MFYKVKKSYNTLLHRLLGDWRYFLYNEHQHESFVVKTYYKEKTLCEQKQKSAIFMANGFCNHAGLCDRLKGMTSIYGWCKKNGVDFFIYHVHPFSLDEYLRPNEYNWIITEDAVCYNKKYTEVIHCMLNHLTSKLVSSGEIVKLEEVWLDKRFATHKLQYHLYTNIYPENDMLFGELFRELFKPAPKVENNIMHHKKEIGNDYISISFRFMQLLGDFVDCEGETLCLDEQNALIDKSIKVVENVKKIHPNIQKILVTADSIKFLNAVKKLPFVYVIAGKVGHINFENSDDVNMKTFLDFFMIANAKKVYLAKSEKMYNSDFARRAAMIYDKDFEILTY